MNVPLEIESTLIDQIIDAIVWSERIENQRTNHENTMHSLRNPTKSTGKNQSFFFESQWLSFYTTHQQWGLDGIRNRRKKFYS